MRPARRIVLASTSPYRKRLLRRLGLSFRAVRPPFEERVPRAGEAPHSYVRAMAVGKARSLEARFSDALILGSDQVAWCEGRILRKPGTKERAVRQILSLAGKEHRLVTAVALLDARVGTERVEVATNRMRIRALTRAEAVAYVERDDPVDCAASYKTEKLGVALFDSMRGDDPTAIEGLPLITVCRMLREAEVRVIG